MDSSKINIFYWKEHFPLAISIFKKWFHQKELLALKVVLSTKMNSVHLKGMLPPKKIDFQ